MAEPWYESVSRDLHETRSALADILGADEPEPLAAGNPGTEGAARYERPQRPASDPGDVFPRSRTMQALMRGRVPPVLAVAGVALMIISPPLRRNVLRALPMPVLARKLIGSFRRH